MVHIRLFPLARMVSDFPQILCLVLGCPRAVCLSPHLSLHLSPGPIRAQLPRVPKGGMRARSGSSPPPGPMWSPYGRWSDSGGLGPGHRYHSSSPTLLLGTAGCPCLGVSLRTHNAAIAAFRKQVHKDATMHLAETHDVAYTGATSQSSKRDVTIHHEKGKAATRQVATEAAAAADYCSLKPEHAQAACSGGPHAETCIVGQEKKEAPPLAHCTRSGGKNLLGPSLAVETTHIHT